MLVILDPSLDAICFIEMRFSFSIVSIIWAKSKSGMSVSLKGSSLSNGIIAFSWFWALGFVTVEEGCTTFTAGTCVQDGINALWLTFLSSVG